ncbi:putative WRKY transcription factor 57 [Panicum miliaceum]|uniref:WRKY transcription factor 57 n=1 Tax=Panicum miliaceum TaxID=4540 RepID=A0A3L6T0U3_PANMI|nr:putative WRKY transcription factor 57 [Panicum miliaceum]
MAPRAAPTCCCGVHSLDTREATRLSGRHAGPCLHDRPRRRRLELGRNGRSPQREAAAAVPRDIRPAAPVVRSCGVVASVSMSRCNLLASRVISPASLLNRGGGGGAYAAAPRLGFRPDPRAMIDDYAHATRVTPGSLLLPPGGGLLPAPRLLQEHRRSSSHLAAYGGVLNFIPSETGSEHA